VNDSTDDNQEKSTSEFDVRKVYLFLANFVFIALGAFLWWGMFLGPELNKRGADDWVEAPCTVVVSEITVGRRQSYRSKVEFTYEVDGTEHRSETYDFTTLNRWRSRCESIVNDNPVGSQRQCFYNPDAPENAVIVRECDFSYFGFIFPLVFVGVGVSCLMGWWPKSK